MVFHTKEHIHTGGAGYESIYNNAVTVRAGNSSYIYTGTIYNYVKYVQYYNGKKHVNEFDWQQRMGYLDTVREPKSPTVEVQFKKEDMAGNSLSGAKITVTAVENCTVNGTAGKSAADGKFGNISIKPTDNTGKVKIKVSEIETPVDYRSIKDTTIEIQYNTSNGSIIGCTFTGDDKNYFAWDSTNAVIKIKNQKVAKDITIYKNFYNEDGAKIDDADEYYGNVKFKIKFENAKNVTISGASTHTISSNNQEIEVKPDSNGEIKIGNVTKNITFNVTETSTQAGFLKINGTHKFEYKLVGGKWTLSGSNNTNISINEPGKTITVKNYKNPQKTIILQKIDEEGNAVPNIGFDLNINTAKICMIGDKIYIDGLVENLETDGKILIDGTEYNIESYHFDAIYCIYIDGNRIEIKEDVNKDGKISISGVKTDDNGQIVIEVLDYYRIGDVNLDGVVLTDDARLIMRFAAGLEEPTELQMLLADINQDGFITAYSADGEKYYCYDIERGTSENWKEEMKIYADSNFCLRDAAKLSDIGYSMIQINAKEITNSLYEKVEKVSKTFYYFGGKAINKEKYESEVGDDNLIKKYIEEEYDISGDIRGIEETGNVLLEIINTPKPYPLTLQKVDAKGQKLGAGYKFTIKMDNVKKVKIHKDYFDSTGYSSSSPDDKGYYTITGNQINCKTNKEGIIEIAEIYAKSVDSKITIIETSVENEIFKPIEDSEIVKTATETGEVKLETSSSNIKIESGTVKIEEPLAELVLDLSKISSFTGEKALKGAMFDIEITSGSFKKEYKNCVTDSNGKITINGIDINSIPLGNEITVKLTETEAPEGYFLPENPISIIKFKYNYNEGHPKYDIVSTDRCNSNINGKQLNVTVINVKNLPNIILDKKDYLNNRDGEISATEIAGAIFKISTEGIKELKIGEQKKDLQSNNTFEATTDKFGLIYLTEIMPLNQTSNSTIKITIEEISTLSGLKVLDRPIKIEYIYNPNTGEVSEFKGNNDDEVKVNYSKDTNEISVNAIDYNVIESLELIKTDSETGAKLPNTEFTLDFGGKVKELKIHQNCVPAGYSAGTASGDYYIVTGSTIKCKTDSNGVIKLKDIVITEKDVICKVTETKTPKIEDDTYYYEPINKDIYFNISYKDFGKTGSNAVTIGNPYLEDGSEIKVGSVTKQVSELAATISSDYKVAFSLKNVPLIDLEGQVWLDAQQGDKNPASQNGIKENNEKNVKDLKVHLYSFKEGKVIGSPAITDENGCYSFIGLLKTDDGYSMHFEYNGIVYEDVGIIGDSKAQEDQAQRREFNDKFKTIIEGKAETNGPELDYLYENNESKLYVSDSINIQTAVENENSVTAKGNTYENQAIKAYTEAYKITTRDANCGLISKYYDLSVNNLIEGVEYKINGKEWTDTPGSDKTELSTSMYKSDYSYRYDDYGTNKLEAYQTELDEDNITRSEKLQEELEVFITYDLQVENLSIHDADEVVVKYTYDASKYELISINDEPTTANGEITLTVTGLTKDYNVKDYHIKFRLAKDAERNLPREISENSAGLTVETTAEIMSYTTAEGALIDIDSEPGNGKEEDDLERANVNFKLKENERQISGNVAEANTEDGSLEAGKNIDDVIVQLVELIEVDGNIYEYIWQETASGSNRVKARGKNKQVYIYNNELPEGSTGQYKFLGYSAEAQDSEGNDKSLETGFIPGNYIIRFIYGDGTVLYLNRDGNMDLLDDMTYNGQDYKSTVDMNYNKEAYNPNNYNGKSSARDNEARRLQVMEFSAEIDGALGTALKTFDTDSYADLNSEEQELLKNYYETVKNENRPLLQLAYRAAIHENPYATEHSLPEELPSNDDMFEIIKRYISRKTWMAAETSKIDVGIDGSGFSEVNFGLMKRPETKLEIEKHITALKITPTGTGVQPVLDAKADIGQILNALKSGSSIETTGIKNGLAVMGSTRADTGFWKVETDIEELMQGAPLEVEYTYVIRNNSEPDYLGGYLVSKFGEGDYKQELSLMKDEIDMYRKKGDATSNGQYLGEYYYTGKKGENDIEVPSIVNTLEEAINNQLAFNETSGDNGFTILEEKINKNIYDTDGNTKVVEIKTVVKTKTPSIVLTSGKEDYSKTIELKTTLSASSGSEIGTTIPSHIAEIAKYSNAAGRENIVVPENLSYVHSDDNTITVEEPYNEIDEFWGETIIISKPTGEDKNTPMLITIITISSIAVLGVGIILIKKFILKK